MDIIKEVENFTIQYYREKFSEKHSYHSIEHTKLVASICLNIAEDEKLDERNKQIVTVAAWFHDIGHAVNSDNHEEESCKIAREFLSEKDIDEEFILEVEKCIKATKLDYVATSLNEKIITDADIAHSGMTNFMEISNLYRTELCNMPGKKLSKIKYWEKTLEFLKTQNFQTKYAIEKMEEIKNENILKVEKRIKKLKTAKKTVDKKNGQKTTARGIETMFRLTARNQINLSSIADNKANIMLTINAVLVSVLVSTSAINISNNNFIVPGLILVIGCLVSLIFAILSVRPKFSSGKFSDEDLKERNVNLLFFGNFYKMEFAKYETGVKEMMDDYDFLYGSLIKDQYNLGKVLSIKYRLLSYSYNVFMFSFVIAVITFFIFFYIKS